MVQKMYSVRDSKAEFYERPFLQHTHAEAQRSFASIARDPQNPIGKNPEDFDLYYLGEYDNVTGKLDPLPAPEHIVKANALLS